MSLRARPLTELLTSSRATESFKQAVLELGRGKVSEAIGLRGANPPVKVGRFISKLLEERPELAIERVEIQAQSGCSNYTGKAQVWPGPLSVTFGEPMSSEGLTEEDAPELAQRVRKEVVRLREERKVELGIA